MKKTIVRTSPIHGRGLYAAVPLPARKKLGEVGGRLVKLPQARAKIETRAEIYLVEINRRLALDCSGGNEFKHLNHSCEPTCYLRIFKTRVEVYALKQMTRGHELTIDYGVTPHKGGMVCLCGSLKCRRKI